ncbi:MAG TPA: hypothetical protein VKZ53_06740 [Candidatus Angelobacter sp.]|nr:hypothetical protein [Candidatus Angelobacter sp.]
MVKFLLLLPLVAFLIGCAPVDSLNPLYTAKDIAFDPALLGAWNGDEQGFNFAKLGESGYRIVMSGKDDHTGQVGSVTFDAQLVELDGHRFLDLVWRGSLLGDGETDVEESLPAVHLTRTKSGLKIEPHLIQTGFSTYLELIPAQTNRDGDSFLTRHRTAHEFFEVVTEDEGRTLHLIALDDSWIEKQLRIGNLLIDHEVAAGGTIVLTADTAALQRLVLDHIDDDQAFNGDTTMHRSNADTLQPVLDPDVSRN